jgi:nucleoside-diphosphate kinase
MESTLIFIKPDGVKRKIVGEILKRFEGSGFEIVNMKMVHLTKEQAEEFYYIHKEKSFFNELINYVTGYRIVAIELKGRNAIKKVRNLIGATDPEEAKKGTIRAYFGISKTKNTVHASDSKETAKREIEFFFHSRRFQD